MINQNYHDFVNKEPINLLMNIITNVPETKKFTLFNLENTESYFIHVPINTTNTKILAFCLFKDIDG